MQPRGLLPPWPVHAALAAALLAVPTLLPAGEAPAPTRSLKVGVVQLALAADLEGNRDKMLRFVRQARGRGCRVVVFPETALYSPEQTAKVAIDAAIAELKKAA